MGALFLLSGAFGLMHLLFPPAIRLRVLRCYQLRRGERGDAEEERAGGHRLGYHVEDCAALEDT